MNRIFKYEFGILDNKLKLPVDAKILKADKQSDGFYIWALIDDTFAMEWREFKIVGTGHTIEIKLNILNYINSIFDGPFVWHLFEVIKHD